MGRCELVRPWINKNIYSELQIHPGKSHMLHYDVPEKIIMNIKRFISFHKT